MEILQTRYITPGIIGLHSSTCQIKDDLKFPINTDSLSLAILEALNRCIESHAALTSSHPAYLDIITQPPAEHVHRSPLDAFHDLSQENWEHENQETAPFGHEHETTPTKGIVFNGRWLSLNVRVCAISEILGTDTGEQVNDLTPQHSQFLPSFVSVGSLQRASEDEDGSDSIQDQWENLSHEVLFALSTSAQLSGGPQTPARATTRLIANVSTQTHASKDALNTNRSAIKTTNRPSTLYPDTNSERELNKGRARCRAVCDFDLGYSGRTIELAEKVPSLELTQALPIS